MYQYMLYVFTSCSGIFLTASGRISDLCERLLGWWSGLQHQRCIQKHTSSVCTRYQHLYTLDTAVSSVISRNVISSLAQRCKLSHAKSKGQVFIALNVNFVCSTEICIVLCVSVLAGEVPMSSIGVTQTCLTFLTPHFRQMPRAHRSAICPFHEWRTLCRNVPSYVKVTVCHHRERCLHLWIVQLKPSLSQTEK